MSHCTGYKMKPSFGWWYEGVEYVHQFSENVQFDDALAVSAMCPFFLSSSSANSSGWILQLILIIGQSTAYSNIGPKRIPGTSLLVGIISRCVESGNPCVWSFTTWSLRDETTTKKSPTSAFYLFNCCQTIPTSFWSVLPVLCLCDCWLCRKGWFAYNSPFSSSTFEARIKGRNKTFRGLCAPVWNLNTSFFELVEGLENICVVKACTWLRNTYISVLPGSVEVAEDWLGRADPLWYLSSFTIGQNCDKLIYAVLAPKVEY